MKNLLFAVLLFSLPLIGQASISQLNDPVAGSTWKLSIDWLQSFEPIIYTIDVVIIGSEETKLIEFDTQPDTSPGGDTTPLYVFIPPWCVDLHIASCRVSDPEGNVIALLNVPIQPYTSNSLLSIENSISAVADVPSTISYSNGVITYTCKRSDYVPVKRTIVMIIDGQTIFTTRVDIPPGEGDCTGTINVGILPEYVGKQYAITIGIVTDVIPVTITGTI